MNIEQNVASVEMSRTRIIWILLSSSVLFVIAISLWAQQGIDQGIVIRQNPVHENDLYFQFFKYISRYGMGTLSVIYSFLILYTLRKKELYENRALFLLVLFTFGFSSLAGDLLKEVIGRARPVETLSGKILVSQLSGSSSFPSGHATKSMGLALPFVIMALGRDAVTRTVKILLSLIAVLVCYSRVALQKHYPSDVLAGAAIAMLFIVIASMIANKVYRKRKIDESRLRSLNRILAAVFAVLAIVLVKL